MEKRILLNDVMFTSLVKKGFLMDGNIQLQLTTREMATLCQGKILEKQHIDWNGTAEYRIALQDIGFDMINEILKRSPIYADLAGNFLNK